jgi:nitroreductase
MATKLNAEEFNELIHNRRSVFPEDYTGESVDDAIVKQMLENARWAPTHKMTEPWRFLVFTGEGIKALARAQSELYKAVTEKDQTFKDNRYNKLLTSPALSSHIIVVIMKRDEKRSVAEVEEIGAVFCAIQNMYLTACAYGVGCYLSTGGITYFEKAKELFGLENDDRLIGFFHIGIPKRKYPEGKRKSVEEIAEWVTSI